MSAALIALGLVAGPVAAETAEQKGYRIMQMVEDRDEGWRDTKANLKMILRKPNGQQIVRKINTRALEGKKSGTDKSLIEFEEPADVRGTVFLTHADPIEPDDQWIYLPALQRTKTIASKRQTGRFMGSEFTFEDLSGFSILKNDYKYLRDERCGQPVQACYVIEAYPKNKYSGYEKVIAWVDKQHYRVWRTDLYNKRTGKHQKTLRAEGFKQYLGKFWRPDRLVMTNLQTGEETELQQNNIEFRTGVMSRDFRKSALEGRQ